MEIIKRYSGVLVKCGDEVLLCKRNNQGSLPGIWSIPAGKINKGESLYNGALREFYEETNIEPIEKLKLIGFISRTKRDGKKNKGLMYVFSMEVNDKIYPDLENAIDGDEHTECGYFNIENIPIYDKNDQLYKLIINILTKN
jgi:ADP-ribose pyrophosphatase YjhB (NUDIX family)